MHLRVILVAVVFLLIAPVAFADCQNCVTYDGNNWNCDLAWTGSLGGPWGYTDCYITLQGQYYNCYESGFACNGGDCMCSIGDCRLCVWSKNCPANAKWKLAAVQTFSVQDIGMVRVASARVVVDTLRRIRQTVDRP